MMMRLLLAAGRRQPAATVFGRVVSWRVAAPTDAAAVCSSPSSLEVFRSAARQQQLPAVYLSIRSSVRHPPSRCRFAADCSEVVYSTPSLPADRPSSPLQALNHSCCHPTGSAAHAGWRSSSSRSRISTEHPSVLVLISIITPLTSSSSAPPAMLLTLISSRIFSGIQRPAANIRKKSIPSLCHHEYGYSDRMHEDTHTWTTKYTLARAKITAKPHGPNKSHYYQLSCVASILLHEYRQ